MKICVLASMLMASFFAAAQTPDTAVAEDYSNFGDADASGGFANQKVLNQSPQRMISLAWEQQFGFNIVHKNSQQPALPVPSTPARGFGGLRAEVNIPVVSKTKIIWQLGGRYWNSRLQTSDAALLASQDGLLGAMSEGGLHLAGLNTIVFKPLNQKNFLLFQAAAEAGWVSQGKSEANGQEIVYSGSALFGWKISDKNMIAVGATRTYRAGQLIYVPLLLWNKTFNDRWGMELLLPARGHLRYNFSTKNMLQLGFELEGSQYRVRGLSGQDDLFLQRGELKPRLMWDKQLFGFFWLNAQAGVRYNWRFDVYDRYDGRKEANRIANYDIGTPFYFNVGIHFVSQ